MFYLLCTLLIVAGAVLVYIGIAACSDPEGRGGWGVWVLIAGLVMFVLGLGWLLWLGYLDLRVLPYFSHP